MSATERPYLDPIRPERAALGRLLRGWRTRSLLTQEELAVRSGLHARTISRLESGIMLRPRATSIKVLADALELSDEEQRILAAAVRGLSAAQEAGTTPGTAPSRVPVLRQLPADVPVFVGRTAELTTLAGTAVITTIDGMAGIGKTTLAVHAAHALAARFPDGQLFMDLHGHSPAIRPVGPAEALERMLRAWGVEPEDVPRHVDDRAALYRSLLADRRVLIVLDNAADEDQVRPLLPGSAGCRVLITGRRRLDGLDGARTVSLGVLPVADAVDLFAGTAGAERLAGTPSRLVREVVELCGLLPLQIRLAAARLRSHPRWTVAHVVELMREHDGNALETGQRGLSEALELSRRELNGAQQRAYRLLGLHPGRDISVQAAAALVGTSVIVVRPLVQQLADLHLLEETEPGRYRFHVLVREHARRTALREESPADRRTALNRLRDHYSRTIGIPKSATRARRPA
ncbi:NB-ARC domain-containing protein [Nonomuraea sp. NPDC050404]|uniref:NB-ARC domain-containing protein n=1 Tax=Nonomuraea sp. NPDC050404 TaxID=3155783 RepID=UPI0033E42DD8